MYTSAIVYIRVEKFYGTAQARKEEDIKGIAANPRKKKGKRKRPMRCAFSSHKLFAGLLTFLSSDTAVVAAATQCSYSDPAAPPQSFHSHTHRCLYYIDAL
jgi:hypothetical protein